MAEYYRNEHPQPASPGIWGGGGGGGGAGWGGGGGGGGAGWGGGGGGTAQQQALWHLIQGSFQSSYPQILTSADGPIQCGPDGHILIATSGCISIDIYCQIQGDNPGQHVSCIILAFSIDNSSRSVDYHDMLANLRNPRGTGKIRAKWQAGHYDYSSIHTARFLIAGKTTPWLKLSMDGFVDVANITVRDGQLVINSVRSL